MLIFKITHGGSARYYLVIIGYEFIEVLKGMLWIDVVSSIIEDIDAVLSTCMW